MKTSPRSLAEILRHPARHPGSWVRLAAIGIALAAMVAVFALVSGVLTPQRLTPQRIVDGLQANAGVHAGYRRNHAKGVCVAGYFEGNGAASAVSRARVLEAVRTPVTGRFAIPGGDPWAGDAGVAVRSMALAFDLPNAQQWRTGMNSTAVFAVNTPEAFYDQVVASRPDPVTGAPDPARISAFYAAHPETRPFLAWMKSHPPSSGFGNGQYYGIHAFRAIADNGRTSFIRWSMVPEDAPGPLAGAPAGRRDFLDEELRSRLQEGPLRWRLVLSVAAPGDVTHDATQAWPEDRLRIDAGTLVIERFSAESAGNCRDINFDPTVLPDGIELSDDPLLAARSSAYAISYQRRTREVAFGAASHQPTPRSAR